MTGSDFGAGIGRAFDLAFKLAVGALILSAIACCGLGWWAGDRYDVPRVEVTRGG